MTKPSLTPISFRMHKTQQLKFGLYGLLCLALPIYGAWSLLSNPGTFDVFAILMLLFIAVTLLAPAAFWMRVFRSRLTFSAEGVFFQGAVSSVWMPWNEAQGFAVSNGETYLVNGEQKNGKKRRTVPISWFTRMNLHRKPDTLDAVMDNLKLFAPQLFSQW